MIGLLVSACSAVELERGSVVRRDSAGVEIVEARTRLWEEWAGSRWRLDPNPITDLSDTGSGVAHEFFRVRGMLRMSNGTIVVGNGGTNEVRLYSREGRFLRTSGGSGAGPGEYRNIRMLENADDTLLVLDADGRLTLLDPELTLVRTFQLPFRPVSIHYLEGGEMGVQFVNPAMATHQGGSALIRQPGVLYRFDTVGRMIDSISSTSGAEEYIYVSADGGRTSTRPLFGKASQVTAMNGRIFLGSADDMRVDEMAVGGDLLRSLRIPAYPLTLTDDQVRSERAAYLETDLPPGLLELPPFLRRVVEELPAPSTRPAYSSLHVDPLGAIWLRPFLGRSEDDAREEWEVIAADGTWLGSVEFPAHFRVLDIEADVVLGVLTDELGIEHPQVLRLRRD